MTDKEKDYKAYKNYIELWKSENPIKTNKLQVLLLTNGILVSSVSLAGGFKTGNWFLFLAGFLFSFTWLLSLGRTCLFQKVWQIKAQKIASKKEYENDPEFKVLDTAAVEKEAPLWLRILGGTSSKYYLLGTPLLFSLLWLAALLYVLIA
ncbi:MAG: hypothetical protein MUF15_25170 [Acidobacteria bacterium]|jgi:hypothetical protein|nr:hypothetical protein [Acidobacteriota bacterium]